MWGEFLERALWKQGIRTFVLPGVAIGSYCPRSLAQLSGLSSQLVTLSASPTAVAQVQDTNRLIPGHFLSGTHMWETSAMVTNCQGPKQQVLLRHPRTREGPKATVL